MTIVNGQTSMDFWLFLFSLAQQFFFFKFSFHLFLVYGVVQ